MKNLKNPFLAIIIFSMVTGCFTSDKNDFVDRLEVKHINWLEGTWKLENRDVFETWNIVEGELTGHSYVLSDQDTMIMEYLSIRAIQDTLYYIPRVLNQNEGEPVPFKSVYNHKKELRFENRNHDFPKVIEYNLMGNDTIKVMLEGTPDQKNEFYLLRYE